MELAPPLLLERRADLEAFLAEIADVAHLALDTEANGLHAYRERVCVAQITAGDRTAVLDAIALEGDLDPLRAFCDRPDLEVVFHGGDFDVSILTRDHGFGFHRVFDTMIAATLLGEERVGLADLVEGQYGVALDKRFQRMDWARRPLTPEQIRYLHLDTAYLLDLRDRLHERLAREDLLEEAEIEFRRLAERRGRAPDADPEAWRRIRGAARLPAEGRAILQALHRWREEEARRRDLPPFKVLSSRALLALAERPPEAAAPLGALGALHPGHRRRYGRAVLAAVARGRRRAEEGRAPSGPPRASPSPAERTRKRIARRREDALREWRRQEAQARGVPTIVVLPNPALAWLAQEGPTSASALAAHPDVGPKRARRYGDRILERLAHADGRR